LSKNTISWGGPHQQTFIQNFVKTDQHFQKLVRGGGNRHIYVCTQHTCQYCYLLFHTRPASAFTYFTFLVEYSVSCRYKPFLLVL